VVAKKRRAHGAPTLPGDRRIRGSAHLGVERKNTPFPIEQVEDFAHGVFTDRHEVSLEEIAMRVLLAVLTTALPIPHAALLKIDRAAGYRNFLPTRTLDFTYVGWSHRANVLRVDFKNKAGLRFEWRVLTMSGSCDAGKQQSFQLAGTKVWWAQSATEQYAWRCVFDQAGKPLRLEAASTAPTSKFAPAGLGAVAASAKRY
jgi:hypothetical protein